MSSVVCDATGKLTGKVSPFSRVREKVDVCKLLILLVLVGANPHDLAVAGF
jgi:hypothetical protein